MKKFVLILICFVFVTENIYSQRYVTKNGHIKFFSHAPAEDIEAHNYVVNSALDVKTGDFVFKVLMKSFEFEKALMQEHFNENYVESHKYPNATFKGKVVNVADVKLSEDGKYEVTVEGDLTIHGVTKPIKETGTLTLKDGQLRGYSVISVLVADYGIKIPKAVVNNIAKEVEITVDVLLNELKK